MTARAARLLQLLEALRQRRKPVTGAVLADEMAISLRTLYRDIATLREQGAQIEGDPGLGYELRPGFTLPPLMFSADELEALALGARWVASQAADPELAQAAHAAMNRIANVLPTELRLSVEGNALHTHSIEHYPNADAARAALAQIRAALEADGYRAQ